MHRKVRSYLQIEQDIIINSEYAYKNDYSSNLVEIVRISESTPVPLPSNTVDNPTAFKEQKMSISIKSSKGLDSIGNDNKQSNWSK